MSLIAPILSLILMVFGTGYVMTYVTVELTQSNYSNISIGFVHAAFYTGFFFGSLYSEKLISRVGHIRVIGALSGLLVATTLLQYMWFDLFTWLICRFSAGLCIASYYVAIESWILVTSGQQSRGKYLALYTISLYLAQSAGHAILGDVGTSSNQVLIFSCLFVALSIIPIALSSKNGPEILIYEPAKIAKYISLAPFGVSACLVSGLVMSVVYSFAASFGMAQNLTPAYFVGVIIMGGALLQWPIGRLSDRYDRRHVLMVIIGASLLPSLILFSVTELSWVLYPTAFIFGGFIFSLYPLGVALVCDCLEARDILPATGVLLFVWGIGSILGPLLLPILTDVSSSLLFLFVALSITALGIVGLITVRKVEQGTSTEQLNGSRQALHPNLSQESF